MNKRIVYFVIVLAMLVYVSDTMAVGTTTLPVTRLQTRFSGLSGPIFLTHAGDGTKRIFIVERAGVIKVVQPGSNTPTEFLNITSLTTTDGERGLLGLAFHPDYETNRRFFVYFTRASDGALQISEFDTSPTNPNVALTTEKPILTIPHPGQSNHNGGTIAFGPDGYLYLGTGDGGSGNDPPNNAQNINSLLGKIIRININTPTGYLIPPTNPFAGGTPGADEIFAIGMRNPFRWSFDRGGSNQLWAADVGQNSWEEVDIIVNGGNYGWRIFEGNLCTNLGPAPCNPPPANYVPPVFVYSSQNDTSRCSITGGYVYRGTQGTLPDGAYIYGDYCTSEILVWYGGVQIPLHDIPDFNLVSFGEDEDGELYVVHAGGGIIQKIVPARANSDFDKDFRTDFAVFRPSNGTWYVLNASFQQISLPIWGQTGDIPVAEDYTGSRDARVAVFRVSSGSGFWFKFLPQESIQFGEAGDIPLPRDFDGDGKADIAVFRPSTGAWYIRRSIDNTITSATWGVQGDVPVPSDFDGDGKADIAVWRPSDGRWYVIFSTNGAIQVNEYGESNDIPSPGDFDNDGRTDLALFRPSTGQWFLKLSADNSFAGATWGVQGDVPIVGDYDGDNRDDIAVWRPSSGSWFVIKSSGGFIQLPSWGLPTDIPIPNRTRP